MFTSKTKGKVLEKQMKSMFRIAFTFTYGRFVMKIDTMFL